LAIAARVDACPPIGEGVGSIDEMAHRLMEAEREVPVGSRIDAEDQIRALREQVVEMPR
jgi:hypothetical protein